jgi:drug/metabolite transporter (DMT)-like permease
MMVWLNLAVISATWGSSFLFAKLISADLPPFAFAFARGGIAMLALGGWLLLQAILKREDRPPLLPTKQELRDMAVLGTTNGWFANAMTVVAVLHADSATVAMLQATVPVIVALLAHFVFVDERLQLRQGLGIAAGLFGAVLILTPGFGTPPNASAIGVLAMVLTALSFAAGTVYGRRIAPRNPVLLAAGQQGFGTVVAGVISALLEGSSLFLASGHTWLLLIIVGVFCSAVPTALYLRLLTTASAVSAALVAYLQPVWAMMLGAAVLGERIRGITLVGTALVLLGVFICTRPRRPR